MKIDKPIKRITISAGDLTSCPRGVYYKKKKTPEPLVHPKVAEIRELFARLGEKGQEIQKRVTQEWQAKGILLSPERFIPWNDFVSGKYDAIVKMDGEIILYEIKGASKVIFDNGLEKPEPYDEHRLQVMIYHYFLKENFPNLKTRILYVERNGERRLEIPVEYKEEEIHNHLERARILREAIENDALPNPIETITWNKFYGKYDVGMGVLTCKWHSLCLEDDHWYEKALDEVKNKNIKNPTS